jgi:H+/Cl- antiporter ClcA
MLDSCKSHAEDPMAQILTQVLIPVALASVVAVLVLGFINMARGGNPWRSQYLMQMRVLLQFVAIVIVLLAIWMMVGQK